MQTCIVTLPRRPQNPLSCFVGRVSKRHRDAVSGAGSLQLGDPIRCGNYSGLHTLGLTNGPRGKEGASSWEGGLSDFSGWEVANCKPPSLNARVEAVCLLHNMLKPTSTHM